MRLALGDDQRAEVAQRIHDPADGDFVARDLLRREDDRVALGELQLMLAERDPAQRRARLALPAGGDDQHLYLGSRIASSNRTGSGKSRR